MPWTISKLAYPLSFESWFQLYIENNAKQFIMLNSLTSNKWPNDSKILVTTTTF
jgi:hypothetical protein